MHKPTHRRLYKKNTYTHSSALSVGRADVLALHNIFHFLGVHRLFTFIRFRFDITILLDGFD